MRKTDIRDHYRPLAIIPAKGVSERLPRKNLRSFLGRPMLEYTIRAALESQIFENVVVSSEDDEIGVIAVNCGAEFYRRPLELTRPTATTAQVTSHVINENRLKGNNPAMVCQLMPNCPLRNSTDIIEHVRLFIGREESFQVSVVPYVFVSPMWALAAKDSGQGFEVFPDWRTSPHSKEHMFCPSGAIWIAETESYIEKKSFRGPPFAVAPMDPIRGIDIDTEEEFRYAEVMAMGLDSYNRLHAGDETHVGSCCTGKG